MNTTRPSSERPGPGVVAALVPRDFVRFDPEPLARLHAGLGPQAAADLLRQTREDLAWLLSRAAECHILSDIAELERTARRIALLGVQVGLPDLHRAARQAAACARGDDAAARAATLARILRMGRSVLDDGGVLRLPSG